MRKAYKGVAASTAIDYAVEAKTREQKEEQRREIYLKNNQLAKLKKIQVCCQQKLEEVTQCNASLLSSNGDQLLMSEIRRLDGEIEDLTEEIAKLTKEL